MNDADELAGSNGIAKDLILLACGLTTSLLTALLLWQIESTFEIDIHSFMILFIVPVGAGIAGCIGASGYYLGARLFHCRPTWLLMLGVLMVSVGTYFTLYYLSYQSLKVDGVPVNRVLSFGEYMDLDIRSTSMQLMSHSRKVGETGELGGWGYGIAALQVLGFALGGFVIVGILVEIPYCDRCSRYFTKQRKQTRYSDSPAGFEQFVKQVATDFDAGNVGTALTNHMQHGKASAAKGDTLRSDMEVHRCGECGKHFVRFKVFKKSSNEWNEISELRFDCKTDEALS